VQVVKLAGVACAGLWGRPAGAANPAGSEKPLLKSKGLERPGGEGDTPVDVRQRLPDVSPSSTGPRKSRVNLAGPPAKPKYSLVTDSEPVP
jgi:hypothetical protein